MGHWKNQSRNQKLEKNENGDSTIQKLCDTAKAVLRAKFIVIRVYFWKQENFQIKKSLHLKELEKEEQTKPKVSRRKEIIKIRVEINKIQTKKIAE